MSTLAEQEVQAVGAAPAEARGKPWALIGTPAVILIAAAALMLYLRNATIDPSMESSLNAETISGLLWQHLELSAVSTVIVLAVAVPLGIALSRKGAKSALPVVLTAANIGQGAPAIGVIVLLAVVIQPDSSAQSFWVAILSMSVYSVLPALRNTLVGLQQVDPALIDAGRGIGMSAPAVLFRVEVPLAVPVILAGIRTTLVLNVGMAALAALIGAGGLGNLVVTGVKLAQIPVLVTGSVLIAILALAVDWVAAIAERYLHPKGV
ncbi:ABC transporter permease [Stackebrandtia nassauensis]|uniref:Binding-protein-dependent transport systems inner membrane component n=1 Tax=Stackebrandtia nassauensis (strain DSM 44728 / CIP 108903 / NRRL B-16338 / NBRC 102104 / LLR-40K-21) TaxID=446470 RepID=D3QBS5_STANL|nr:ABC transporter permease [Stackebrandtia nassauensis]ADD44814.1 binding-protein-dependent transport systems inner membrane component [Stackebrandtia nassauensis DSM 44728]